MQPMKLDEIDVKILQHLQREARISNVELANRVGLSPAPCLRRVRALEEAGIHPSVVAGCSIGAVVGACYAALPDFDRFRLASTLFFLATIRFEAGFARGESVASQGFLAARDAALGGHRAASTLVTVPALARPEWKMEIAVVAAR